MPVEIDGESVLSATTLAPNTTTLSGKTSAGSDRIAIVAISAQRTYYSAPISVEYGAGNAMTSLGSRTFAINANPDQWIVELFAYANPPTVATDVIVTWNMPGWAFLYGAVSCATYKGASGIRSGSFAGADAKTIDIASATGDLVVDALLFSNVGGTPSTSPGSGQTLVVTGNNAQWFAFGHSYKAGASSVTMSWGGFNGFDATPLIIGASIEAAASGVTGTGAVTAEPAEVSAAGTPIVGGTAAPSPPAATAAAAGTTLVGGTGSATAPAATVAGAGSPVVLGDGDGSAGPGDGEGEGSPVGTGTAGGTAEPAEVSASGTPVIVGTGAVAAAPGTGAASGTPVVSGTGAVTAPAADAEGAQQLDPIDGTGAVTAAAGTAAASGTPVIAGSGVVETEPADVTASGSGVAAGTGAVETEPATAEASGTPIISGAASVTAPAADVDALEVPLPTYAAIIVAAVRTSQTGVTAVRSAYD